MYTRPAEACASFETPWGEGSITVREGKLAAVRLPSLEGSGATEHSGGGRGEDARALKRWAGELGRYFRGERLSWCAEEVLDGCLLGGGFTREVYEALLEVPAGETISYAMLAERAGHARASRAVGSAMARNPVPVVVPCHRVIRSDGSLGRYGGGAVWKERLLHHEKAFAAGSEE